MSMLIAWADCADTGVIRTTSRQELLYTRSYIAVTAKAHKLKAIDMVRQANIGILPYQLYCICIGLRELQGSRLPAGRM